VFRLVVVLFCLLCLIVVPLPPGENPFAVKINIISQEYIASIFRAEEQAKQETSVKASKRTARHLAFNGVHGVYHRRQKAS
jgi:hypothetical protein